ncbi:MAG: pyruvate dehydrogenase (acetyl-transferring) E1 component subunit alpha, partial [Anaerolineales bacterium]|nr:pyruvate dehydrogenase (acetyl-transferring) E1 component subunit alpha [Anaerolineales bacterium]
SYSSQKAFPIDDISIRAESYGIPGTSIDGNDLIAVYSSVREAVERARNGSGPSF